MKTQHPPKLKPRPLFSCGIFSYCTQSVLSPTHTQPPTLPPPSTTAPPTPPPPPPPPPPPQLSKTQPESSSSSSSTSQSFTQWRFPLPKSPIFHPREPEPEPERKPKPKPDPPPLTTTQQAVLSTTTTNLAELFHVAELHLSTGSDGSRRLSALHLLESSLVPNPPADGVEYPECPRAVMGEIVGLLKDTAGAKAATKVLLALCLAEANRQVAVEAGAVGQVVEALAELEGAAVERALAALELLCTVAEGAAELRAHALAVPMLVEVMGKTEARGKECAISALSVVFGGGREEVEPAEEVARAVVLALQGECSARGRRKGAQLLRVLRESERVDITDDGRRGS